MQKMNRAQRRTQQRMAKQKYTIANLVFGVNSTPYPTLFLENQLKSLCDPTNIPALKEKYDVEYVLFTDEETLQAITRHPQFMALSQVCPVNVIKLEWPPDSDKFASRYGLLVQMFHHVLPVALEQNSWLSVIVADLVFAKHALPRMLKRLETGHDAVFNVPIRSAADSVSALLARLPAAPTDMELFEMAYANLHHLWVASHWDAPMFSKFPYSMVWNSGTGLAAHNFGVTPIVFKPTAEMKGVQGVIDADVPSFFKNPFWATDWTDAPVAGVEPLSNGHYPPFMQHRSSVEFVTAWAKQGIMPAQVDNLDKPLFYPSKARFNNAQLAASALETAQKIQERIREGQGK
jgi:hypothetical protein